MLNQVVCEVASRL